MNTFKFTVNRKQYQIQDELHFIGLGRVRDVAQVLPGTKLFIRGKDDGKIERVRVGHFFLFPHEQGAMTDYQFFTKGGA